MRLVLAAILILGLGLVSIPFFLTPPAYLDVALRDAVFGSDLTAQRVTVVDDATGKRLTTNVQKVGNAFLARLGRINSGRGAFTVHLDGYKAGKAQVEAAALQRVRAVVELTPQFGRLEVTPINAMMENEPIVATVKSPVRTVTSEPPRPVILQLPGGTHHLTATAPGYCVAERNFDVREGKTTTARLPLSPELRDNEIARLVLSWVNEPSDLDAHFKPIGGQLYGLGHVFYRHKEGTNDSGQVFARLDVDHQQQGAQETITVLNTAVGNFELLVHRYTQDGSIGRSGAVVHVYTKNCQVKMYAIPPACDENMWDVVHFHYDGRQVTISDQMRCRHVMEVPGAKP
ncbi:MAG TPA: hypothetical protein VI670_25080 [Thermoanaerobaculia bacterium]